MTQEWISEIDGLRGVAILAVIAVHTSAYFTKISTVNGLLITNVAIYTFSRFAVPLFLFISGYVLSLRYQSTDANYYVKRIKSIMIPYIIFSLFYLLCITLFEGKLPSGIGYNLLTGGYGFLWFLVLLLQLYLLYPFFKAANHYILVGALIVQLVWESFGVLFIPIDLVGVIFLSHIFYFVLGIYAQKHLIKIRSIYLVLIPVLIAISSYLLISEIIEYGGYNNIPVSSLILNMVATGSKTALNTLTIIGLYNIAFSLKWPKTLLLLGKYSFGIYLIQYLFVSAIHLLLVRINITPNNVTFYPILFASVLILSFWATWLIWRLPFSNFIFGNRAIQ